MKKFLLTIGAITVLIIAGGVFLAAKTDSPKTYPLPQNPEYFWGEGCPHCRNVEDFMSTWDKKDRVAIDKKEVWSNAANADRMRARYEYCQIPESEMGVPLIFTPDGKCLSGDVPIIEYLKTL